MQAIRVLCRFSAIVYIVVILPAAHADVIINPNQGHIYSPEEQKAREDARRQREEAAKEAARKEQAVVDAELARRGWPKSREGELRKFFDLQKQAAAIAPKPGAGSALKRDVRAEWEQRSYENTNANSTNSSPAASNVTPSTITSATPKSYCWEVDAPPKVAVGYSRISKADAQNKAMVGTKGCKIVGEKSCTSERDVVWEGNGLALDKNKNIIMGDKLWDCRVSYHCGETEKRCEIKSSAASAQ